MSNTPANPRFTVRQTATGFVAHDNVSQLDYDLTFTRRAAERYADRRNAANSTAPEGAR